MVLAGGGSLRLHAPTIIIKSIEFEFDSCHLSTIDHSDQKRKPKKLFKHLFQYYLTSNTLQLTLTFKYTFTPKPMIKTFTIDQKIT